MHQQLEKHSWGQRIATCTCIYCLLVYTPDTSIYKYQICNKELTRVVFFFLYCIFFQLLWYYLNYACRYFYKYQLCAWITLGRNLFGRSDCHSRITASDQNCICVLVLTVCWWFFIIANHGFESTSSLSNPWFNDATFACLH